MGHTYNDGNISVPILHSDIIVVVRVVFLAVCVGGNFTGVLVGLVKCVDVNLKMRELFGRRHCPLCELRTEKGANDLRICLCEMFDDRERMRMS